MREALATSESGDFFTVLVDVVFAAGSKWTDNASRRALAAALAGMAKEHGEAFAAPFLTEWAARTTDSAKRVRDFSLLLAQLSWGSDVLAGVAAAAAASTKNVFTTPAAAPAIAAVAGALFALVLAFAAAPAAASASKGAVALAPRALARALSAVPALAADLGALVKKHVAAAKTPAAAAPALRVFGEALAAAGPAAAAAGKSVALQFAVDQLAARDPAPAAVLAALAPVFSVCTAADLAAAPEGSDLLPALLRTCRRSPPVAFALLGALLRHCPADTLAPQLGELLPPIVSEVRGADTARRALGHGACRALAAHLSAPAARVQAVQAMANYLLGRNGAPAATTADMKGSLVTAIASLASARACAESTELAAGAVCEYAAKEALGSPGRELACNALAALLAPLPASVAVPAATVALLTADLAAADPACTPTYTAMPALRAVALTLAGAAPEATAALAAAVSAPAVADKLAAVVATAALRPAVLRATGLAAAAVLAMVRTSVARPHHHKADGKADAKAAAEHKVNKDEGLPASVVAALASISSFANAVPVPAADADDEDDDATAAAAEGAAAHTVSKVTAGMTEDELSFHLALVRAVLRSHAALLARASDKTRTAVAAGEEPVLAGFFRSLVRLRTHPCRAVRARAAAVVDPLLATPALAAAAPFALAAFAAELEAAEQGGALAQQATSVVAAGEDGADDITPIYVTNWDGQGSNLTIRKYFPHNAAKPAKNPLTDAPAPGRFAGVWGPVLTAFAVGSDPATLVLALTIAGHPLLATTAADATATVKHVVNRFGAAAAAAAEQGVPALCAPAPVALSALLAAAPAAADLLTTVLFAAPAPHAWFFSPLVGRRRAALLALATVASQAPAVFTAALAPRLVAELANPAVLDLTEYQVAVYRTPAWKQCEMADPAESDAPRVAEDKNVRSKAQGMSREDAIWFAKLKAEQEARRAAASAAAAENAGGAASPSGSGAPTRGEKEAAIRRQVESVVQATATALAAVQVIAGLAPLTAHNELLVLALPALHQLIFGARLPPSRAGATATTDDDVAAAGTARCTLLRNAAERALAALAPTLDLHVSHDAALLDTVVLATQRAWEQGAHHTFAVTHGAAALVAYRDSRAADVVALSRAVEALSHRAGEHLLSAPTFAFLLPAIDALLRFGPLMTTSDKEAAAGGAAGDTDVVADAPEDIEAAAEDAAAGVPVNNTMAAFVRTLEEAVVAGVHGAAKVLAVHGIPAAASANPLGGARSVALRFPVPAMLSLALTALARVPDALSDAREDLTTAVCRLATTLPLAHTDVLTSDAGVFAPNKHVRRACLSALAKTQVLLAHESLSTTLPEDESAALHARVADLATRVWTLCHDTDAGVVAAAKQAFAALRLAGFVTATGPNSGAMLKGQTSYLAHPTGSVRLCAAAAVAALLRDYPALAEGCFASLRETWLANGDLVRPAATIRDKPQFISRSDARLGVVAVLAAVAPTPTAAAHLPHVAALLLGFGLTDLDDDVWDAALQAGLRTVHALGAGKTKEFMALLEAAVDKLESPVIAALPAPRAPTRAAAPNSVPAPQPAYTDEDAAEMKDRAREGAIVLLGTLARYFPTASNELVHAVEVLRGALASPARSVQRSVAKCIAPLAARLPGAATLAKAPIVDALFDGLFKDVFTNKDAVVARGAAMGVAALVSGLRGPALARYAVLDKVQEALSAKQAHQRHGALCLLASLFTELGVLMTPHVTRLLPQLLALYGANEVLVRDAAKAATLALMGSLNNYGVRLVLPMVTTGLKDKSWRTKIESIELLGAMAGLAPRELGTCLPMLVPRLLDVLSDPNADVQSAAKAALGSIGSAIRNPEVRVISPVMITALTDPSHEQLAVALESLFTATFRHYVDPAALAFVMPLVRHGLRERDARLKLTAVQIAGAVAQVVSSPNDLLPYTPLVMRYLKTLLMDAHPETRVVTARALGAMAQGKLTADFADLKAQMTGVLSQLEGARIPTAGENNVFATAGTNAVQRSGAALGLAQMLLVEGPDAALAFIKETVEAMTQDARQPVREGYYVLLDAMPTTLQLSFAPLIADAFPMMLRGLSDASIVCREAALRAGMTTVIQFARTHTLTLLPPLVEALIDPDSRTRFGAVQLTGSLLLRLAGLSGKLVVAEQDEDPNAVANAVVNRELSSITTPAQERLIEEVVGAQMRNDIYTSLYLMQSDVVDLVSRIAGRVWKVVTVSTTRTLEAILPAVMDCILADITSQSRERQGTAENALMGLVSQMGDRVLRTIVPILLENLLSPDASPRHGVMVGIGAILRAGRKLDLVNYMQDFIAAVRTGLGDESGAVRAAAGGAFANIHHTIGDRVVHETVPALLEQIAVRHAKWAKDTAEMRADGKDEEYIAEERDRAEDTLSGLQAVLKCASSERRVCEIVIPHFVQPPVTTFHARCLAAVAQALGAGFGRYVDTVVQSMLVAMTALYAAGSSDDDDDEEEADEDAEVDAEAVAARAARREAEAKMLENVETLIAPLEDEAPAVLDMLLKQLVVLDGPVGPEQIAAIKMLQAFFCRTRMPMGPVLQSVWCGLLPLLLDDSPRVLAATADCVGALTTNVPRDTLIRSIAYIRTSLNTLTGRNKDQVREINEVAGFGARGAFSHFMGFFQHGLVAGSTAVRSQAAAAMAELVELSPAEAVKSHAIKLTGPLIRSFGDRHDADVRVSILQTLTHLVAKVGPTIKAFQAQLLATFLKALQDDSRTMRGLAAGALATLQLDARRVDGLVGDLLTIVDSAADAGVAASVVKAVYNVLQNRALLEHVAPETIARVVRTVPTLVQSDNDAMRADGALLAGVAIALGTPEDGKAAVAALLDLAGVGAATRPAWNIRQGVAMALSAVLISATDRFKELVGYKPAVRFLSVGFRDENVLACTAAIRFAGRLLLFCNDQGDSQLVGLLLTELLNLCAHATRVPEAVATQALSQIRVFAEQDAGAVAEFNTIVVPGCVRARTGAVKAVRKEADLIMYHCLGFADDAKDGMDAAEEFAKEHMEPSVVADFIALCKRSVAKAGKKGEKDEDD